MVNKENLKLNVVKCCSLICGLILFLLVSVNASAEGIRDDGMVEKACEKALEIIQPMNEERLNVSIGNVCNIVDSDGELDGFSLGYFVDEIPYGYAIYSIENDNIREFVFSQEVDNMYKVLENKAEECSEVNENELIDGIVYEGGIDYCVYDKDGQKVEYCEDSNIQENSIKEDDLDKIKETLEDNKPAPKSSYPKDGFYMCDSLKHTDIPWGKFYTVPDAGMAMITSEYIQDNNRTYACTLVSALGMLNWMGRNHGTAVNTYDLLWKYMVSHNCIPEDGVSLSEVRNCFNNYYFSNISKTNTRAVMDYSVTFEELRNHVGGALCGEKAPCSLSIWVNQPNDCFAHTVTVVSTMEVSSNEKYVGIWNGWNFDNSIVKNTDGLMSNTDTLKNAYKAIRYILWSDLTSSNVSTEAMYLQNCHSLNIKEAGTSYVSGDRIELSCFVPNGTSTVGFPTWTNNGGQDDLIWHAGNIGACNLATCSIDLDTHNKESGTYITHIYAYDSAGNILASYGTVYNVIDTKISNISIVNKTASTYTVRCKLPTGTAYVKFPTWTDSRGQDDLIWHIGTISNGYGSITINSRDHKNELDKYITHIYAYDKYNNYISSAGISVWL